MKSKRNYFLFALILASLLSSTIAHSQEDESPLFTTVAPDALIVLDLSGSMRWTPNGATMYTATTNSCTSTTAPFYNSSGTGHTQACTIDPYGTVPKYAADVSCNEPFYHIRMILGKIRTDRIDVRD